MVQRRRLPIHIRTTMVRVHPGSFSQSKQRAWIRQPVERLGLNPSDCEFESHSRYFLFSVSVEQSGVLATLSRWRPWVQIPSGTLFPFSGELVSFGESSSNLLINMPPQSCCLSNRIGGRMFLDCSRNLFLKQPAQEIAIGEIRPAGCHHFPNEPTRLGRGRSVGMG